MSKYYRKKAQQGFSLVELMIAMLLGLLLLVGVVNLFLGSSQTYRLQEALFRVQESGRFALDIIQRDLKETGFQIIEPPKLENGLLRKRNKNWSTAAVTGFAPVTPLPSAVINNGVTSEILRVNPAGVATFLYLAPDVNGESALFRNGDAMVEGVVDIRLLYGEDTSNDRQADVFRARTAVTDWGNVVAVRVDLLVAGGAANVVDAVQVLPAPFNTFDTSDRRMYHVFSRTVALRNKMR